MIDAVLPLATGLFLWFKADTITGVASGTPVDRWADSSSSKYDATMEVPHLQPLYQENVANGKPTLRFHGGQRLSTVPIQFFRNGRDSLTLFIVFQAEAKDRASCLVNKASVNPTPGFELALDPRSQAAGNIGIGQIESNAVSSGVNLILPSNFYIFVLSVASEGNSPENISMQLNATNLDVSKTGAGWLNPGEYPTNLSAFDIGARRGTKKNRASPRFFSGDIAEILAFSHKLSPPDLGRVGCYLQKKYNISAAVSWCSLEPQS
ncbi:MAG: hypothetical protein ABIQ95_09865 [Bdellovibrionia bacterium]